MEEYEPKELAIEAFKKYEFDLVHAMSMNKTEYSVIAMGGMVEMKGDKKVFTCRFKTSDGETSLSLPLDDRIDPLEEEIPCGATKALFLLGSGDEGIMVVMRDNDEQAMWLDACIKFFELLRVTTWQDIGRLIEGSYDMGLEEAETDLEKADAKLIKARSPFLKERNSRAKERSISTDEICKIMKEVLDMHPYRVQGDPDSYSDYNQGWTDALFQIDAMLQLPDWED